MKKLLIYLLFLFLVFNGNAQNSFNLRTKDSVNYTSQILIDSAAFFRTQDPTKAFDYALRALEGAIQTNNEELEADCYKIIGDINSDVQQYDLAIDNYQKALGIYSSNKLIKKEQALMVVLADAYSTNNQLDLSESYFKQSAQKAKKTQSSEQLRSSKKGLAKVYKKQGDNEKAIQELEELRQMDIDEELPKEQYNTNRSLIEAYTSSQPVKALELSEENEQIAIRQQDTAALVTTYQDKADVFQNMGNTPQQLNTLQQSAQVRSAQKDYEGLSEDQLEISEVLLDQNKVDEAIDYLEQSIQISEKTGQLDTRKAALKSLSRAYDQSGNYVQAYRIYQEYVQVSEQAAKVREEKILENLALMQSLTKRLQRMDMLENQKELNDRTIAILEQEQEVAKKSIQLQRRVIISLLLGLALLLVLILLVFKSARQKRIANQLLALRSLRSQMNPHFIFNALNSVNSYISKSDERAANKYLSDFSRLMRAVMENSKFDFVSLQSEIDIMDLYLKLEHHRFASKFDYSFEVDPNLDTDNIQIPPMLIQPYIENAIWHGLRYRETKGFLLVKLIFNNSLEVVIEDNGIGRKKSQALKTRHQKQTNSTGLKNTNSRIALINQLHGKQMQVEISDLDKNAETGTRVHIVWM